MIIRCSKCETKFRFDDEIVTGEGVWVRCSRCQHVFFHDNPAQEALTPAQTKTEYRQDVPVKVEKDGLDVEKAAPGRGETGDGALEKEDDAILSKIKEIREAMAEEERGADIAVRELDVLENLAGDKGEEGLFEETLEPSEGDKKRGSIGKFFAYLFLLLLIVIMLGAIYLWVFPQAWQRAVEFLSPYSPVIERFSKDRMSQDQFAGQVIIQDVRQRFVYNWLMGNLRVVEGSAVNATKYPLTRIQVRGRLYGNRAIIGEAVSFCGNLLTDAELATLTQDEIQRKLDQPLGSNIPNERISPHGQIPFMIVFIHNLPAVEKVTVSLAGAEKLLE
ncbi:MAG TPA: zinc-ribbon domain-containing protein [Syntrophales bacterium]|nr:zinc-ribbon domain-containing protein [Syntrophales bacterium]